MNWRASLNMRFRRAHGFYGVITIATLIGLMINFVGINPMRALVVTAVINGVVAVPLILLVTRIAGDSRVMGRYASARLSNLLQWATFFCMAAAAVGMIGSYFQP